MRKKVNFWEIEFLRVCTIQWCYFGTNISARVDLPIISDMEWRITDYIVAWG
jgi:hypothetical protein